MLLARRRLMVPERKVERKTEVKNPKSGSKTKEVILQKRYTIREIDYSITSLSPMKLEVQTDTTYDRDDDGNLLIKKQQVNVLLDDLIRMRIKEHGFSEWKKIKDGNKTTFKVVLDIDEIESLEIGDIPKFELIVNKVYIED